MRLPQQFMSYTSRIIAIILSFAAAWRRLTALVTKDESCSWHVYLRGLVPITSSASVLPWLLCLPFQMAGNQVGARR